MDELPGALGTSASLALRLGQTVFSSASLLFMCLDVEFYSYTAFCYLVTVMGLVIPWSMILVVVDVYCVFVRGLPRQPRIILVIIAGDLILSGLLLAAASSTASVTDLLHDAGGIYCPAKLCLLSQTVVLEAVAVQTQAIKLGIGSQVCVQNALITVYVSCGLVGYARQVFDDILERTLVTWNLMIGGYSKTGFCKEAFLLFQEMRELGVAPDEFTLVSLLSVCSLVCDLELGRCLHLYIEISGIEIDLIVRNALLDMYAKCGHLDSAKTVFDLILDKNVVSWTSMFTAYAKHGLTECAQQIFYNMPEKNVVSWNSMISSYVKEGRCGEALELFHKMCALRVVPDEATLVSILSACSQIGDLIMGRKIHNYMYSYNFIPGVTLFNSLIDMYAKCGSPGSAMEVFYKMPERNLVSWNVVIGAMALHGCGLKAIELFEEMQACGVWPDEITFTGLLSACSHSGLVDLGKYYFNQMSTIYRLSHEIEHYACMVDLLGRGGLLGEAIRLIGRMPVKPDVVVFGALLGACRTYGNVDVGKQILKHLLVIEPQSSGLLVLVSNIFCEAGRWEDVKKIRKLMNDHGIRKCRAISFIEIDNRVHEFLADDKRHEMSISIYSVLDQLTDHLKSSGYSCNLSSAYLDVEEI
ncbi:hypothetical protein CJ030_MR5G002863 [Morella rubra]|uniref:Casparian strip membrane protein domain-containing protein n=1 Tax=Morella rubra TaxID=262757 RepID=A0A6A1VNZ3_9ROSI|nr:hypothetical protein CJ030_MR5G002863 [Morella rubra]